MSSTPAGQSSVPTWLLSHFIRLEAATIERVLREHEQWALVVEVNYQDTHIQYDLEPVKETTLSCDAVSLPALAQVLQVTPQKVTCLPAAQGNRARITVAQ